MHRKLAVWIAAAAIFFVVFGLYPNNRSSILVKELGYVCAGSLLALVAAWAVFSGKGVHMRAGRAFPALLAAVAAWMLFRHFTGIQSVNGPKVIFSFIGLGLFTCAVSMLLDRQGRDAVMWGFLAAWALLTVYTATQWMNAIIFPWDVYLGPSGRYSGALGNPNLLGSFMSASLPACAAFLLSRRIRSAVKSLLIVLVVLLTILMIVVSGTRASIIGLVSGSALLILLLSRSGVLSRRALLLTGVSGLLAAFVLFFSMRSRFEDLSDVESGTSRVRLVIWSGALDMFAEEPLLGYGPGSFQIVFPSFRDPRYSLLGVSHNTLHAHSEYLEILTDLGLVGALLFAGLAWAVLRAFRKSPPDLVEMGLASGIAALLAEASVSVALRWPPGAFHLALFTGLLLAGRSSGDAAPVRRVWGIPLLAAALFLPAVSARDYWNSILSGHYLFVGKDLMLDRVETELGLAGSAALAWEQTGDEMRRDEALSRYYQAATLTDSSIEMLQRCVELNPGELGGWYGLGSAWLSRAIVLQPVSQPLARLLAATGCVFSRDSIVMVSERALAAYESLAARAPDYAELHNNFALTYTRLGRPAEAIHSLRRAWELHAHRRVDYIHQIRSISPLGGWLDASHVLWLEQLETLAGFDSGSLEKMQSALDGMERYAGLVMAMVPESAESIAASFASAVEDADFPDDRAESLIQELSEAASTAASDDAILGRWLSGDTLGLGALLDQPGMASASRPVAFIARHMRGARAGDAASVDSLIFMGDFLIHTGYTWAAFWPWGCAHLEELFDAVLSSESPPSEWRRDFLDGVRQCILLDGYLYSLVMISGTDFKDHVDPSIRERLSEMLESVGGPQQAMALGLRTPWVPGSIMGRAAARLDSMAAAEHGRVDFEGTRLAMSLEVFSSPWWGGGTFRLSEEQRDSILLEIVASRQVIADSLGEEMTRPYLSRLILETGESYGSFIMPEYQPFLDMVESDIVNGTVRESLEMLSERR